MCTQQENVLLQYTLWYFFTTFHSNVQQAVLTLPRISPDLSSTKKNVQEFQASMCFFSFSFDFLLL